MLQFHVRLAYLRLVNCRLEFSLITFSCTSSSTVGSQDRCKGFLLSIVAISLL